MIRDNLRTLRLQRAMTQAEFAVECGVTQNTVSQWETGDRVPRAPLLPKIADVLGCSIDELLRGGEDEKSDP